MTIEEQVETLLSPIVATLGVELLEVTFTGGVLRITVDSVISDGSGEPVDGPDPSGGPDPGDGPGEGITTDQLAAVNRLVGPVLDQHDPIPGRYTLEVSSPGLERRLSRPEHFRRAIGEIIVAKMAPGLDHRRYKGELSAVEDDTITMAVTEIDGVDLPEPTTEQLPLGQLDSARTVFEWGPKPKPGGGGKRAKGKRTKQQSGTSNKAGKSARSRGVR